MIRLAPTVLVLGECDLKDFEKRKRQRQVDAEFDKLAIGGPNGPCFNTRSQRRKRRAQEIKTTNLARPSSLTLLMKSSQKLKAVPSGSASEELETPQLTTNGPRDDRDLIELAGGDSDYVSIHRGVSPENIGALGQPPSSSLKESHFQYRDFIETSTQDSRIQPSSPFVPDDISTPQQLQPLQPRSTRSRAPLPRSPLYLSHNVSASPERRPSSGLTPRVLSRVATHSAPGIIFAQPARRPPKHDPRRFRHQTNSFSFDESERSSAAYDQERIVSDSTSAGSQRQSEDLSLHEELGGKSLNGSIAASARSLSGDALNQEDVNSERQVSEQSAKQAQNEHYFMFSSPQLPLKDEEEEDELQENEGSPSSSPRLSLPPPFSSRARSVSRSGSMPRAGEYNSYSETTPARSSTTTTPNKSGIEGRNPTPNSNQSTTEIIGQSRRISSPNSFLARLMATYKSHSPLNRHNSPEHTPKSRCVSPTPRKSQSADSRYHPQHIYQVYNDALSPDTQPQTPAHLPESRHQSRFHSAWTAPVNRTSRRRNTWLANNNDGAGFETPEEAVERSFVTPSRGHTGRSDSPSGLLTEGFQGLYGGRENGDDEQSWVNGVRFDNAEIRLWGDRDARNDARALNETPEREDWRAGLR